MDESAGKAVFEFLALSRNTDRGGVGTGDSSPFYSVIRAEGFMLDRVAGVLDYSILS